MDYIYLMLFTHTLIIPDPTLRFCQTLIRGANNKILLELSPLNFDYFHSNLSALSRSDFDYFLKSQSYMDQLPQILTF